MDIATHSTGFLSARLPSRKWYNPRKRKSHFPPMRTVRVGIVGLGQVGAEVARQFLRARPDFERRLGAPLRLAWVCDRHIRSRAGLLGLPASTRRTPNPLQLLRDPGLDILVELTSSLEEARRLVCAALASGKHLVTANKKLLAHHWPEILRAARQASRSVYFEASVAGGIPIIQALRENLASNQVRRVLAILNGTTNFVLTRLAHDHLPLSEAVREAQRLGLAERDTSADLSGLDTAHKLSILASLICGGWVKPQDIPRSGIRDVDPEDVEFAGARLGRALRLLGTLRVDWGRRPIRLEAGVQPTLVPLDHPLASVHGEYNAVLVNTSLAGDLMFYGKGAGPKAAASAVLGDVLTLSKEVLAGRPSQAPGRTDGPVRLAPAGEEVNSHYLRFYAADRPGVLSNIAGCLGRCGVSIAQIYQERKPSRFGIPVMLTTHPAPAARVERALRGILALSTVHTSHTHFRML